MGTRLLPAILQELYAHALILEREATKRFAELERYMRDAGMDHIAEEFESIGREEREQYELLAVGTAGPRAARDLRLGIRRALPRRRRPTWCARRKARARRWCSPSPPSAARRTSTSTSPSTPTTTRMCAFAAEMAADEGRHIARLERLLAREPDATAAARRQRRRPAAQALEAGSFEVAPVPPRAAEASTRSVCATISLAVALS